MRSWRKHFVFLSVYLTGSGSHHQTGWSLRQPYFLWQRRSRLFAQKFIEISWNLLQAWNAKYDSVENIATNFSCALACVRSRGLKVLKIDPLTGNGEGFFLVYASEKLITFAKGLHWNEQLRSSVLQHWTKFRMRKTGPAGVYCPTLFWWGK